MDTDPRYKVFTELSLVEQRWSAREELLKAHGYTLRPRLRKGWTPSWIGTDKSPLDCEDAELLPTHLVDATTEDGKLVFIKELDRGAEESRIAQMLCTKELSADPRNHSVQIIEVIDDPEDDTRSYMVMPLLRNANNPPFQSVKEIIDFVDQILEGLVFLHERGVAHRDCVMHNLMMDGDAMYPDGFHPVRARLKRDYSGWATYLPRSAVGVKYYFVDFGISVHIPEDVHPKLVTGDLGRDQDPPELYTAPGTLQRPYDPFKLDVFIIGNMFKRELHNAYSNIDFLMPLVEKMIAHDPEERPTAERAFKEWSAIRETIYTAKKEWRLRKRREELVDKVTLDVICLYQLFMHFARSSVEGIQI